MTDNVLERLALEETKFVRCAGGRGRRNYASDFRTWVGLPRASAPSFLV